MHTTLKKAIKDEKGAALAITLVLLMIGGLIMAPLLGHMGTGQLAGQVHEKRMGELYAADAGVEMAIWQITNDPSAAVDPMNLNDKEVDVEIEQVDCRKYRITSSAETPGKSSSTVVADFWAFTFLDNAITSRHDVRIESLSNVYGRVQYGGDLTGGGTIHGEVVNEEFEAWPEWEYLYDYYYGKYVLAETAFEYRVGNGEIRVTSHPDGIGPMHWTGDLNVKNNPPQGQAGAVLKLNGTLYVNGDLTFDQAGGRAYTIDLNGQTIFVEGAIEFPAQVVTVAGRGNIIAVGNIDFLPAIESDDDVVLLLSLRGDITYKPMGEFTGFIMSVAGEVEFKPMGNFSGSVAGVATVDLDPQVTITWIPMAELDIDFPFDEYYVWRIRSYNISQETLD